jgi:hypothetical protein
MRYRMTVSAKDVPDGGPPEMGCSAVSQSRARISPLHVRRNTQTIDGACAHKCKGANTRRRGATADTDYDSVRIAGSVHRTRGSGDR